MESFKPVFIVLSVLAAAALIFFLLRLDKPRDPGQTAGNIYNWKQI